MDADTLSEIVEHADILVSSHKAMIRSAETLKELIKDQNDLELLDQILEKLDELGELIKKLISP